MFEINF